MITKYPVEQSDSEGIVDAVNYLLSGPAGLGQNFAGFSTFAPAYLTGNFRVPYTSATANLYVAPISLATAEWLDERTTKYTFSSAQPSPPFANGNGVTVSGVLDPFYDGTYGTIGVVSCTTTYVILRTVDSYAFNPPSTGGTIELTTGTGDLSTDANARVTVTGGQDRVFISGQLDEIVSYDAGAGDDLTVSVRINRYYGYLDNVPVNPDYKFGFDATVAEKVYTFTGLSGTGSLPLIETVFATVLDEPDPGYYWYILEVAFEFIGAIGQVTTDELKLRSLSAQVVKQ